MNATRRWLVRLSLCVLVGGLITLSTTWLLAATPHSFPARGGPPSGSFASAHRDIRVRAPAAHPDGSYWLCCQVKHPNQFGLRDRYPGITEFAQFPITGSDAQTQTHRVFGAFANAPVAEGQPPGWIAAAEITATPDIAYIVDVAYGLPCRAMASRWITDSDPATTDPEPVGVWDASRFLPLRWQTASYDAGWLPTRILWRGFLMNTGFYGVLTLLAMLLVRAARDSRSWLRRSLRRRRNRCLTCGYSRKGLDAGAVGLRHEPCRHRVARTRYH